MDSKRRSRLPAAEISFFNEASPRSSIASPAVSAHLGGADYFPSPLPSGWYQAHEDQSRSRWSDGRGIDNFRNASAWIPPPHRSFDPLDAVRLERNRGNTAPRRLRPESLDPSQIASRRQSHVKSRQRSQQVIRDRPSRGSRHNRSSDQTEDANQHDVEVYITSALRNAQHPCAAHSLQHSSHAGREPAFEKVSDTQSTITALSIRRESTKEIPPTPPAKDYQDATTQVKSHTRKDVTRYRDMAIQTSPASSRMSLKTLPSLRSMSSDDKAPILPKQPDLAENAAMPKGLRFWALMLSLMSTTLLAALEGTIVSTALPTVVGELNNGANYLWAANAYFLTNTAIAPFYAQMADIFGRRPVMLTAVSLFLIGNGVSGGARNMDMLIGGRTVQGLGAGGLQMMVNLVISDLIPPRERPQYLAMSFGVTAVASGLGPVFSGLIVSHTTWRWVFWLSLPLGGVALVLLALFLQTKHEQKSTLEKFKSIDYVGHILFMPSVVAILIALTYAGPVHAWNSWQTLVPLIVGFVGLFAFVGWEASGIPSKPNIPIRVLKNRTSATVFVITFLHSMLNIWSIYFLPVFFQAVQLSSAERSGVQLLPNILPLMVTAMVGGKVLQRIGRYRELQMVAFALMIVSFGLFSMLSAESTTAFWVLVQILQGAATGFAAGTLLPAAQAPLEQKDIAAIVGTFSFIKSFGMSWGVTLPATIFNNKFTDFAVRITSDKAQTLFADGAAYSRATAEVVGGFPEPIRGQVIGVYTDTLKFMWQIATGVCGLAFLLVFLEKHYELRKTMKSAYGMKEGKKQNGATKA